MFVDRKVKIRIGLVKNWANFYSQYSHCPIENQPQKGDHGNLQSHAKGGEGSLLKELYDDVVEDKEGAKDEQEAMIQSRVIFILHKRNKTINHQKLLSMALRHNF